VGRGNLDSRSGVNDSNIAVLLDRFSGGGDVVVAGEPGLGGERAESRESGRGVGRRARRCDMHRVFTMTSRLESTLTCRPGTARTDRRRAPARPCAATSTTPSSQQRPARGGIGIPEVGSASFTGL
jgi:hypothetical protein